MLYALHTFRSIAVLWIEFEDIVEVVNIEHLRHWVMFAALESSLGGLVVQG